MNTVFTASTHDYIFFFTNTGRVYRKKGYQIPEASRTAKGTHLNNIFQFEPGRRSPLCSTAGTMMRTATSSWSPAAAP